ncbi:hypothetical protein PS943_01474 [Pseudomonas fluorescens]|uniref:Uncharacterized protein n=1 Tax=Pseudomonas fluorescens TaxID=294 RepID=A0A5E7W546_PSEFL|nr:hypothetical protein PS943_01474 [Pseudomonas fluorescens]
MRCRQGIGGAEFGLLLSLAQVLGLPLPVYWPFSHLSRW